MYIYIYLYLYIAHVRRSPSTLESNDNSPSPMAEDQKDNSSFFPGFFHTFPGPTIRKRLGAYTFFSKQDQNKARLKIFVACLQNGQFLLPNAPRKEYVPT